MQRQFSWKLTFSCRAHGDQSTNIEIRWKRSKIKKTGKKKNLKSGKKTLLGINCNDFHFLVLGARHQVVARHCTAETQSCPRLTRPLFTAKH